MPDTQKTLLISLDKTISVATKEDGDIEVTINGVPKKTTEEVETPASKLAFAQSEKRKYYQNFLSSQFENLMVLSGAGTSVGWGGKTMRELWDEVEKTLTASEMEKLCKAVGFISSDTKYTELPETQKDLEKLLSRANIAKAFVKEFKGIAINIEEISKTAEKVIHDNCKIELKPEAPHELFLNKVTNRKLKDPRVKIFTLNYDTLFEKAAIRGNFTVIDGFSFSHPRTLSGRNFDYDIVFRENSRIKEEESFVPKVFHLYKPHGSVDWELQGDHIIIKEDTKNPLMIFPKDSKYENSYEQPFFEMMARFQQCIRKENVLLISIGFSFGDKHIVTAIKEAVTQNPSFRLLIINRTIRETDALNWFITKAKIQKNVIIISEEFADFALQYPSSKIYGDSFLTVEPENHE